MTEQQYIINRKLNILDLGKTLGNISEACRRLDVSRRHYYDLKQALAEEGVEGLLEKSRRGARARNRVSEHVEATVLAYSLEFPTHGQTRTSNELKKIHGIVLSPGGVRSVWIRHHLGQAKDRLKRLEEWARVEKNILTESQVQALEQAKEEKQAYGEIETFHPGYLFGQDTYYVGYIKGIGKIYQQTGIDTFSNVGFAKVYTDRNALVAADFLNDKVLPFFDEYGIRLHRTLTDRGSEYCGRKEDHAYELFCHLADVEHTRTKARHPQTNGSTEKLNQTLQNEFYAVFFRKTVISSLEQLQRGLDEFLAFYNTTRTNQGKRCQGRTPMETFEAGLELYDRYNQERQLQSEGESVAESNISSATMDVQNEISVAPAN